MEIYLSILAFLTFGFLIACIYLLLRNEQVYRFRGSVLDQIFEEENWKELLAAFEQISYTDMVNKFWKTLPSFYEGTKLERFTK
jgi:hypothetical protein